MSEAALLDVQDDDDGQRLDRWLKKRLPGVPYALLQKLMRTGQVRVDGKRAKAETRLVAGQKVRVPPVDIKSGDKRGDQFRPQGDDKAYIESLIIYDDGDIIALNKPFGLPCQGGSGIMRHVDGLLKSLTSKKGVKPRLVHRLDRDTSGVLLVARSLKMAQALGRMFSGRGIRKYYWAVVTPAPETYEGRIDMPLNKGLGNAKDKMIVDEDEGKTSITDFALIEHAGKTAAFMAFWPRTGRTHQIRVHAAEGLKCPILGDEKYGRDDELLDNVEIAGRLHLHARRVIFKHPATGKTIDITAPLPPDLKKTWKALGFDHNDKGDPFADQD